MGRALILALFALLQACATAPRHNVTVTTATGHVYQTTAPTIEDPRTHGDGSRMDWVELAVVKVNGGLPEPEKPAPVWGCYAADVGTTAVGIGFLGAAEANPLGLAVAVPLGIGQAIYAKHREKQGKPFLAKAVSLAHCGAAAWNALVILSILL